MGRKAEVYNNKLLAGILEKTNENQYFFQYDEKYFSDNSCKAISF